MSKVLWLLIIPFITACSCFKKPEPCNPQPVKITISDELLNHCSQLQFTPIVTESDDLAFKTYLISSYGECMLRHKTLVDYINHLNNMVDKNVK